MQENSLEVGVLGFQAGKLHLLLMESSYHLQKDRLDVAAFQLHKRPGLLHEAGCVSASRLNLFRSGAASPAMREADHAGKLMQQVGERVATRSRGPVVENADARA